VFTVRWLETVAVGVFVYQSSHSAFFVALMTMLRLLPSLVLGPRRSSKTHRSSAAPTADLCTANLIDTGRWRLIPERTEV
jgi:hypothetical protein